jgi:endo-1,4-beta-D-glucanase Y
MMQAKNNLKLMSHQQAQLHARLIKLSKDEERAQKRIRDAQRKAAFLAQMHEVKKEKRNMLDQMQKEIKAKEDQNRSRINHHRSLTKDTINTNKLKIID